MKRISPALVVATVAVVLSAAGGAVAASQITGRQIKNSSLTGADVRNKSLTSADFRGTVRGRTGRTGPTGPQGAAGAPGPAGPQGPAAAAITDIIGTPVDMCSGDPGGDCQVGFAFAQCPDGQVITGGGFDYTDDKAATNSSVVVNDVDNSGSAWIVVMINYGDAADLFATARCLPGTSVPGGAQAQGLSRRDVRVRVQRLRARMAKR